MTEYRLEDADTGGPIHLEPGDTFTFETVLTDYGDGPVLIPDAMDAEGRPVIRIKVIKGGGN